MSMHHIWRLQQFLGVAQAGSFHAGAALLNISQPALTKSIRLLEESMGAALFLRLPRGVRLTEAGEALFLRAREIEQAWNAALVEVDAQGKGMGGLLRIGGGPVYSAVHFPEMLAHLRVKFPKLKVSVATGVGRDMMPSLRSGEIRAYAGGVPQEADELGLEFESAELYQQFNALYASGTHPLFAAMEPGATVDPARALDYPWLSLLGTHHAVTKIQSYYRVLDLPPPELVLESPSVQIALRMLRDHAFLACMPAPLADAFPGLRRVELPGFAWSVPTGLTYRRSSLTFPPLKAMIQSLREITLPLSRAAG